MSYFLQCWESHCERRGDAWREEGLFPFSLSLTRITWVTVLGVHSFGFVFFLPCFVLDVTIYESIQLCLFAVHRVFWTNDLYRQCDFLCPSCGGSLLGNWI